MYGDGVYRDYLNQPSSWRTAGNMVDAEYCTPSSMLAAYFLKWALVFSPRDVEEIWVAHAAPRRWFAAVDGFSVSSAPALHRKWKVGFDIRGRNKNATGTAESPPQTAFETTATVTVLPAAIHVQLGSMEGGRGVPTVSIRLRCSEAATVGGAVMQKVTAVGATVVAWDAKTDLVSIAMSSARPTVTVVAEFYK
jgi:hypothetical protein